MQDGFIQTEKNSIKLIRESALCLRDRSETKKVSDHNEEVV